MRPYEAGDDVRRIDWNVTARTSQTHVRVELAERVLVTWLVYDASASMAFGTAERRKADVAEGVALAVGHTATRRGNRLGLDRLRRRRPPLAPPPAGPAGPPADPRRAPRRSGGKRRPRRGAHAARRARAPALARRRRLGLPRADRLAERAAPRRRPPPDARGRDPRPARAGARRRRRAAPRRSGDRPPAARRHERPQAPRALRRRGGRGADGPRPDALRGRRPARGALDRGRLAARARRLPAAERLMRRCIPFAFKSPWLLLFLLLVPAGDRRLPLARPAPRRHGVRALGGAGAAAEHGRRRSPGRRRYVPAILFAIGAHAAPRRLRAARGEAHRGQGGRDRRAAWSTSPGSMAANDLRPTGCSPPTRLSPTSSRRCRRGTASR